MDYKATKDHDEIRTWVEERAGRPIVRERRGADGLVIDIAFGDSKAEYESIGWDEFFDTFDSLGMEFRYEVGEQDGTDFSYSIVDQQESVDDVPNDNEMPEDDVPIENVIPSAPIQPGPDALNQNMNYTE